MKSNLCPSQRPTVDSMFTMTAQVAQTCATAGNGEQMGAEDNGGRRRAGAGYLEQGPAKSAEEVVIGLLGDALRLERGSTRFAPWALCEVF